MQRGRTFDVLTDETSLTSAKNTTRTLNDQ